MIPHLRVFWGQEIQWKSYFGDQRSTSAFKVTYSSLKVNFQFFSSLVPFFGIIKRFNLILRIYYKNYGLKLSKTCQIFIHGIII